MAFGKGRNPGCHILIQSRPLHILRSLERNQGIVIALNSVSLEGWNTQEYSETEGSGFSNVTAAQPLVGMDWNDLLVVGAFKEENQEQTIKDALCSRLLLASNFAGIVGYTRASRALEKKGLYEGLLEFRGATWFCKTKKDLPRKLNTYQSNRK